MNTQQLLNNPSFIADLRDYSLSSRAVAARWGVGKTFVNKHRNKPQDVIISDNTDGPAWPVIQQARPEHCSHGYCASQKG